MRIDNKYIKNHLAEKPPTEEFATTPYDDYDELRNALIDIIRIYHEIKGRSPY